VLLLAGLQRFLQLLRLADCFRAAGDDDLCLRGVNQAVVLFSAPSNAVIFTKIVSIGPATVSLRQANSPCLNLVKVSKPSVQWAVSFSLPSSVVQPFSVADSPSPLILCLLSWSVLLAVLVRCR
jgi:hypothetical protein